MSKIPSREERFADRRRLGATSIVSGMIMSDFEAAPDVIPDSEPEMAAGIPIADIGLGSAVNETERVEHVRPPPPAHQSPPLLLHGRQR